MRLPRFLRKLAMIEGLKLTIFAYKWEKCVKPVGTENRPLFLIFQDPTYSSV